MDLSTLYGNNQAEQDSVRTLGGLGTLHPDTIASSRLMVRALIDQNTQSEADMALDAQMMPPAVVVILIIFSRNHNTIASKLLAINEKGAYS